MKKKYEAPTILDNEAEIIQMFSDEVLSKKEYYPQMSIIVPKADVDDLEKKVVEVSEDFLNHIRKDGGISVNSKCVKRINAKESRFGTRGIEIEVEHKLRGRKGVIFKIEVYIGEADNSLGMFEHPFVHIRCFPGRAQFGDVGIPFMQGFSPAAYLFFKLKYKKVQICFDELATFASLAVIVGKAKGIDMDKLAEAISKASKMCKDKRRHYEVQEIKEKIEMTIKGDIEQVNIHYGPVKRDNGDEPSGNFIRIISAKGYGLLVHVFKTKDYWKVSEPLCAEIYEAVHP
ncbi:hypothetical protein ACFLQI_01700 [Candidatus Undinarchaeota archaeon]